MIAIVDPGFRGVTLAGIIGEIISEKNYGLHT